MNLSTPFLPILESLDLNVAMTFFAVLVRMSVLMAVFPFFGETMVPTQVKLLLGLVFSVLVFPIVTGNGQVHTADAAVWGATVSSLASTVALEILFGLAMGYTARIIFDCVQIAGELAGNFMGFAAANQFDPFANMQNQVISKLLYAIAVLLFLALDGHHILLRAAAESYRFVQVGRVNLNGAFAENLVQLSSGVLRMGLQLAAPLAVTFFGVNIVFGIMSKAMPQMNILVLSFSISAVVGFAVLALGMPAFQEGLRGTFGDLGETLARTMRLLGA
jgi:flagellar biosynthetic protein FliR